MSTSSRFRVAELAAFVAAAAAAAAVVACGDLYADPVPESLPPDQRAPSVVGGPARVAPQDRVEPCPRNVLVEGAACNNPGLACELGSSPDMHCNTTLACVPDDSFGATWTARPSMLCPSYECPSGNAAAIDGAPCAVPAPDGSVPSEADELVCAMTDATCACTTGTDAAHAHERRWVCVKPQPSCPQTRPLAGQSCTSERQCDYGACAFKRGMRMECNAGVWRSGAATCN
jgi:hypothetical protein